jgi:hypothetical protein
MAILTAYHQSAMQQPRGTSNPLAVLPLMTLGLEKCSCFKDGTEIRADMRASALATLETMGLAELETYIRPRLIPLQAMEGQIGLRDEKGIVALPEELPLSAESLKPEAALLLDNGFSFYLRLGRKVSPTLLNELFGVESITQVDCKALSLRAPQKDDNDSSCRRLYNVLSYLRKLSPWYQQLHVIKEGDPTEISFYSFLIEDKTMTTLSLTEFNALIQKNIGSSYR